VIRLGALLWLVLLLAAPARAEPPPAFDPALTAKVYAAALAFMAPRTLEPVPVSQFTLWGLRGLTALDPLLTTERKDDHLLLALPDRVLADAPAPASEDPQSWAAAAASLSSAAVLGSAPVRRAGTRGVVQAFFDELFNHLDAYSRYVPPDDASEDIERRHGEAGAGLSLARQGSAIVVREAIQDGPGAEAGIRPGDVVLSVDGRTVRGQPADTVADWIAGPEDTDVAIVWRNRDGRIRHARVQRDVVPPETVYATRIERLLVLQVTSFNQTTDVHLSRAIEQGMAANHPPDGIVIDLRGNRGGLLRQAVAASDALLSAGIVAFTAGRDPAASRIWRSGNDPVAPDIPVVVLVDGRSASAAEILAAALADRGRGVVVGSSTLGKGLVQVIDPLPDGGELFLTWSRVLAPHGWPIQGLGVLPQVCTSRGQDALRRQLAALAEGTQPMAAAIAAQRTARMPLSAAEIIALRSPCPAAEGRDSDLDTARTLIDDPAAYAAALLPPMR
jgi:carboxyl-terminal processing protease